MKFLLTSGKGARKKKLSFLADASAKAGGGGGPPAHLGLYFLIYLHKKKNSRSVSVFFL